MMNDSVNAIHGRMPRFYSQSGEDCLLWHFFEGATDGFYVDVGAFDGQCISNTLLFEHSGWDGICIEPNQAYLDHCRRNRPNAICIQAACVGDRTKNEVDLHVDDTGLFAGLDAHVVQEAERHYQHYDIPFHALRTHRVPAVTLEEVLDRHVPAERVVDLLSVDVEGAERDVLGGLNLRRWRPRVIVVEANTAQAREDLTLFLADYGYIHARSLGVNEFFVRTPDDVDRMREIAFECQLHMTDHPLGEPFTTLAKMNDGRVTVDAEPDSRAAGDCVSENTA